MTLACNSTTLVSAEREATGYYMLLLPDLHVWQGFYLNPLSFTEEFVRRIRGNLVSIPFDPDNQVVLGEVFPDLDLTDDDIGCLMVLGGMLIHDAMAFSLTGICAAANGIVHITRRPFFWIEGYMFDDGASECSMGQLESETIREAQVEAHLIGFRQGYK
jgi:hypothetical protein